MYIYGLPISLYSFKLRLAIALKGACIDTQPPPGGTYRSAEFCAINPASTIPALVDGEFVLAEVDAIVEYLDDVNVGDPLLPSEPKQRARTRMLSRWCDLRLEPHVRSFFPMIQASAWDENVIASSDAHIAAALDLFEKTLDNDGPYALGERPGLVDCGLTASLSWLYEFTPKLKLAARPGAKLARSIAALRANSSTSATIADYQDLVRRWVVAI
jgi:glutathione S-transferase